LLADERSGALGHFTDLSMPSLFPLERIFEPADGVLDLTLYLFGLAFGLQLGITHRLADHLLDCAFDFLRGASNSGR